uniref:DNA-directed RNA polymerase subunit omega n=1 Tax=Hildenbrandia rivularis TaxID=135206 RepID=A0A1C9CFI7_9FLOR|nr:hypothetical protein Hrvl_075 [Hildenbrandia rivularis]AOM67135.1 hypothetical protein Hrvl_075 [Hildenbrandia rivularis]
MFSQPNQSNNIIYKTEELLNSSTNRYGITLEVANRAKRRKYEDLDIVSEPEIKPIIKAITEMLSESTQA